MIKIATIKNTDIHKQVISVEKCPNFCLIKTDSNILKKCEFLKDIEITGEFTCKIECKNETRQNKPKPTKESK